MRVSELEGGRFCGRFVMDIVERLKLKLKPSTVICGEAAEEITKLREQLADSSNDALRLIETIKYLKGIAERGTGSELPADKTVESFVLEYVKNLESSLRAKDAVIEKLREALVAGWSLQCDFDDARQLADEAIALSTDNTQILDEVRRAEREKCAKVCETQYPYSVHHTDQRAATNCAEAIRAME